VALLSVAVIALQLVLMQILSITQWHHFAYMVISVALLGFGAAGTVLALARSRLLERSDQLLPLLMFGSAAVMATAGSLSQAVFGGFDSFLLFADPGQFWRLLLGNLFVALPFFLAALAIGLVFVREVERIGSFLPTCSVPARGQAAILCSALRPATAGHQRPFALAAGLPSSPAVRPAAGNSGLTTAVLVFGLLRPALVLSQARDPRRPRSPHPPGVMPRRPGAGQAAFARLRWAPGLAPPSPGGAMRTAVFVNGNCSGRSFLVPELRNARLHAGRPLRPFHS
jgi:hypothetical protein